MGYGGVLEAAVLIVGHLDRAPVGEQRNREVRDLLQRLARIERAEQGLAGLGEKQQAGLALARLRDVGRHADKRSGLTVIAAQDMSARVQPPLSAIREQHETLACEVLPVLYGSLDLGVELPALLFANEPGQIVAVAARLRSALEPVERAHRVRPTHTVGMDVPFPEAGPRRLHRQAGAIDRQRVGGALTIRGQLRSRPSYSLDVCGCARRRLTLAYVRRARRQRVPPIGSYDITEGYPSARRPNGHRTDLQNGSARHYILARSGRPQRGGG